MLKRCHFTGGKKYSIQGKPVVHFLRELRGPLLPRLPCSGPQITLRTNSKKGGEPGTEMPVGAGRLLEASQIHKWSFSKYLLSTY